MLTARDLVPIWCRCVTSHQPRDPPRYVDNVDSARSMPAPAAPLLPLRPVSRMLGGIPSATCSADMCRRAVRCRNISTNMLHSVVAAVVFGGILCGAGMLRTCAAVLGGICAWCAPSARSVCVQVCEPLRRCCVAACRVVPCQSHHRGCEVEQPITVCVNCDRCAALGCCALVLCHQMIIACPNSQRRATGAARRCAVLCVSVLRLCRPAVLRAADAAL